MRTAVLGALALLAGGCGRFYLHNEPVLQGAELAVPPPSARARQTGSLWRENVSANFLFSDVRARFPGDLLTVLVVEDASGSKEAATSTKTNTDVFGNLKQFFGLPQKWQQNNSDINPEALIEAQAKREWDGEGATSRKGKLTARITALVTTVAPNGNLWVEGEKVVAVNREDQHVVVAGWVRPEDINAQNEVLSSRLAQARIDYYGVGVLGSKQHPGWAMWVLDLVWPF
jgi:flagellar L-ring protein precursor FlgH